jgi:hypothetical protein
MVWWRLFAGWIIYNGYLGISSYSKGGNENDMARGVHQDSLVYQFTKMILLSNCFKQGFVLEVAADESLGKISM